MFIYKETYNLNSHFAAVTAKRTIINIFTFSQVSQVLTGSILKLLLCSIQLLGVVLVKVILSSIQDLKKVN